MINPFITDAQATQKNQQTYNSLQNQIGGIASGFKGVILVADKPTEDGAYQPSETSPTPLIYPNAGGLTYDPQGNDKGFLVTFIKKGGAWSKSRIDIGADSKIKTWSETTGVFTSGAQTFHEGKIWESNSNVIKTDVPDVSTKWDSKTDKGSVVDLSDYLQESDLGTTNPIFKTIPFTLTKNKVLNSATGNLKDQTGGGVLNFDINGEPEFLVTGLVNQGVYQRWATYNANGTMVRTGSFVNKSEVRITPTTDEVKIVIDVRLSGIDAFNKSEITAFPYKHAKPITLGGVKSIKGMDIVDSILGKNQLEALDNIKVKIVSRNLFDKSNVIYGFGIDSVSGEITPKEGSAITIIPVDGVEYRVNNQKPSPWWSASYLDENYETIGYYRINRGSTVKFTPVEGTKFIVPEVLTTGEGSSIDTFSIEKEDISRDEFIYDSYRVAIEDNTKIDFVEENLFNKKYLTEFNKASNRVSFNVSTSGNLWFNFYYKLVLGDSSVNSWKEFDENDVLIHNEALRPSSEMRKSIKTKPNTTRVEMTMNIPLNTPLTFDELADLFIISRSPFRKYVTENLSEIKKINGIDIVKFKEVDIIKNKILATFGDSITDFGSSGLDGGWAYYILKNTEVELHNYARGNATVCNKVDTDPAAIDPNPATGANPNNVVSVQIKQMIDAGVVPDIVVITGGTNDSYKNFIIGDLDAALDTYPLSVDSLDLTRFNNVLVWAVAKLRAVNPYVAIYFASPIRSLVPSQVVAIQPIVNAIKDASIAFGGSYIDFHNCGVIQYPNEGNPYFADKLHPSQLGVNVMGAFALKKILTTYKKVNDLM